MKTTKKLLIILCASALLVATVFSVALGAAVAGEGTTMNEYLNMKLSEFEDFEDGEHRKIFRVPVNYTEGSVVMVDTYRKAPSYVYDDAQSTSYKYYVMDYDNNVSGLEGYIEPVLGKLDNIDKTPVNGFVSEFDIAFFSPIEYEMVPKTQQMRDPVTGEELWEEGTDEAGLPIPKTEIVYRYMYDENGEIMKDSVTGEEMMEPEMTPKLVYVKDANGKVVFDENDKPIQQKVVKTVLPFEGLSEILYIDVQNTHTYKDGAVDAITFQTYAKPADPNSLPTGFDPAYKDTGYIEIACTPANPNLDKSLSASYKFKPDEWLHLTFRYDAKSLMMHIYVGKDSDEGGRKQIASVSALDPLVENKNNLESPVYPLRFRIGSKTKKGEVGYDNFLSYQGTTIHDPEGLNKMQPNEVIEHYVGILENSLESNKNRYQAYVDLKEHVMKDYAPGSGTNAQMNQYIDTFYKYDNDVDGCRTQLESEVNRENVATFIEYVNAIGDIERTLGNTAQREVRINMARDFLDSCGKFIDKTSDDCAAALERFNDYQKKVEQDKQANAFIDAMVLYENAIDFGASISRIKSHYEKAAAIRPEIANYEDFYIPPTDGGEEVEQDSNYINLQHATLLFDGDGTKPSAEAHINSLVANDNSRRFVNYMNIFSKTSEAEWIRDDGTLENLWYMALNVKRENNYNTDYTGMNVALDIFERVDDYFWGALQAKHVAILTEKLSTFDGADSNYIYKAGVCTYVDNYLAVNENDIDPNNESIKAIKVRNEAYKAQLGVLIKDYQKLLEQNTAKFVNVMKLVAQYTAYEDVKPLFDEATGYYYTMNLTGDKIEEYTAQYEALRLELETLEAYNSTFLAIVGGEILDEEGNAIYVALADATTKSELYRTLNACYEYVDKLDATYEGVGEALELYNEKYAEYVGEAKAVNAQISETVDNMLSVRGNWDIDSILAFVKKLFYR